MCGVVALLNLDGRPVDRALLARMTATLAHRGPDGEDVWVEGPVGLGHRRLAVFDTSETGRQPMMGAEGRMVVSFNGALYDFRERRAALEKEGVAFRGASDTEVLANVLERSGPDGVAPFNGMFAFAAWDRRARLLHLMRDRFGQKPLYVWRDARTFVAASEIRAILAHPDVPKRPNVAAIGEYLTFQNIFRGHSMFAGVELLAPASHMSVAADGAARSRTWWAPDFTNTDDALSFEEATEETRRLMKLAVQRQSTADVEVGSYLSGGLDSGSITALAVQHLPRIATFTCGFDMSGVTGEEAYFDERRRAEQMAMALRTRHYECVLTASDIAEGVEHVVAHLEDLRLGMAYPNWFVAGLASRFVKVTLSGAGGDELFGGYPWRYYRVFRSVDRDAYLQSYFRYWQRLIPEEDHAAAFTPELAAASGGAFETFASVFDGADVRFETPEDQIAASLMFETRTFLHGLLVLSDRISAAHGLEERTPFLDRDLVDFAMRVPVRHKLANLAAMKRMDENALEKVHARYALHDDGKNVLRHAMYGLLPEEVRTRPKQGFSSPESSWYRGEASAYVQRRLGGGGNGAFVRPDYVRTVVQEHLSGHRNHRLLIWSLLCLESWVDRHFPELGQG